MKPITGRPQPEGKDGDPTPAAPSDEPFASLRRSLGERAPRRTLAQSSRLTVPAIALAALVVGWLFATRVLLPAPALPTDLTEVPDLGGLDSAAAAAALADEGLQLGQVDLIGHSSVEAGRVFGQSPLPGQLAQDGGEVRVTLSAGAEFVTVPDVRASSLSDATEILEAAGFGIVVDDVESDRPGGEVLEMEPQAGEKVRLPLEVRLSVSVGPVQIKVPNLVRLTLDEAERMIDSLGLELTGVEERFRFGQDQGRVLEQNPEAGAVVDQGSGVRLVIGRRRR